MLDTVTTDKEKSVMIRLGRVVCCMIFFLAFATIVRSDQIEPPGNSRPPTSYKVDEVAFTLERGFCHGECPIYKVEVLGNGTVFYNGERYVRKEGQQSSFVTHDQVLQLLYAFYDAGFIEMRSEYVSKVQAKVDDDGQVSTLLTVTKGLPLTVVTLRVGDYSKQVRFQTKYAPERLFELATLIDDVVDSKQWVSPELP